MAKELLGKTKNDMEVYFDNETSHAVTHIQKYPKLLEYVKRLLPTIEVHDRIVRLDHDMGETVGKKDCVETTDKDEIVYALRPLRSQYSRFVKNREAEDTNCITIDLRKISNGTYELYTAFVGNLVPSFPGGNFLPGQSAEFWSHHALVWGGQEIIPGTETDICPW